MSSPIFSNIVVTYSQLNLGCVAQSMFEFSSIFGKVLGNISNIMRHDVHVFLKLW
jgi:hypothetical protein